jgi:hypothetical protein
MTRVNPGQPTADEYSPYYGQYIGLVPDGDVIELLDRQIAGTAALLAEYTEAQADWRPAPGEWNAKEIVGHLSDGERLFSYRALRFARNDPTRLTGFDPNVIMAGADFADRPLAEIADEFVAVRRATIALFRSLSAAAWARDGVADGTPVSVRALAYIVAGHELHHRQDLERIPSLAARATSV